MDDRNVSFDALLGRALMEANWREYGSFWAEAETPRSICGGGRGCSQIPSAG